jgi:uncharacterized membrane protein YedE/YeeE
MAVAIALACGILFGAGLTVSGMTNPAKILNFLDLASIATGRWDPTLLAVFAGALAPMFIAWQMQAGAAKPWVAGAFQVPTRSDIDGRLAAGSALFGVGWGLAGLCPGPAIAAIALAPSRPLLGALVLFFGAMLAGVWLARVTGYSGALREAAAV